MKRYKLLVLMFLGVEMIHTSCDDFLTENPRYQITIDNAVRDYESAKNIVSGMYGVYEQSSELGGKISACVNKQAGLWKSSDIHFSMSYTQSNTDTDDIWRVLYRCINAANAAINSLEAASDNLFPSVDAKESLLGEARCFRGFMNLQLLWYFGHWFDKADSPYGIIYRDKVSNLDNLMIPRCTVGESYQYILDDLTYAEKHLSNYTTSIYMSVQFAQALHAKLLLIRGWEGDYEEALNLVNMVLEHPGAATIEPDIDDLYETAWDSKELLFAQNKIDIIAQSTGKHNSAGSHDYVWSSGLFGVEYTEIPTAWLKEDPRYNHIFGWALGAEQWQVTEGTKQWTLTKLYHGGRIVEPNARYCTYVLRLVELYIMKAELLARINPNNLADAIAPINEYRAKYTDPQLSPLDIPKNYEVLMEDIFKEYVVALFMENEAAWFASIRIKTEGDTWLKKLKGNEMSYTKNQYCWPIPNDEIIAHTNPIAQNPGLE